MLATTAVLLNLAAFHIDMHRGVAERLYLEHVFIGDIATFNGIAHPTAAHHREVGIGALHLRGQHHPRQLVCTKRTLLRSPSSLPLTLPIFTLSCSLPFSRNGVNSFIMVGSSAICWV